MYNTAQTVLTALIIWKIITDLMLCAVNERNTSIKQIMDTHSTRVGETGRAVDDKGGGELPGPRLGDTAVIPVTSWRLAAARLRICRCSGVSGMLCKVMSQWPCSTDVC